MSFIPQTNERSSPLGIACGKNHPQVALLLINHGANINYQDGVCNYFHYYFQTFKECFPPQYGMMPLHWASQNGHPEVVKILLQSQASVNVKSKVSTVIFILLVHYNTDNSNCKLKCVCILNINFVRGALATVKVQISA